MRGAPSAILALAGASAALGGVACLGQRGARPRSAGRWRLCAGPPSEDADLSDDSLLASLRRRADELGVERRPSEAEVLKRRIESAKDGEDLVRKEMEAASRGPVNVAFFGPLALSIAAGLSFAGLFSAMGDTFLHGGSARREAGEDVRYRRINPEEQLLREWNAQFLQERPPGE